MFKRIRRAGRHVVINLLFGLYHFYQWSKPMSEEEAQRNRQRAIEIWNEPVDMDLMRNEVEQ